MLPTIRQLQYLKLLAEHGAFGKAADAAHVTMLRVVSTLCFRWWHVHE